MRKISVPVVSIVLYVLAALMLAYSVWAGVYSSRIVSEAIDMGQLVFKGSEFEIISFYMQNLGQYFLFAVVLFGLGWILQNQSTLEWEYEEEEDLDVEVEEGE